MNFNSTVLAIEMDSLQKRENEMYELYSGLAKELKNDALKKQIKFIRDQELGHIEMVTTIIAILQKYISKG
jgi:rubrerythrin